MAKPENIPVGGTKGGKVVGRHIRIIPHTVRDQAHLVFDIEVLVDIVLDYEGRFEARGDHETEEVKMA